MIQRSLFVSHGAPDIVLNPGTWGSMLSAYGQMLCDVKAVLVISPHWRTRGLFITSAKAHHAMHDFGSFPEALYEMEYHPPGATKLAEEIATHLSQQGWRTTADALRGLDHGAWIPLMQLFPDENVPVLQLSMPIKMTPLEAYQLGEALQGLSRSGVLVMGSGCLTHNLKDYHQKPLEMPDYVMRFTEWIRDRIEHNDRAALIDALTLAPDAELAHPTSEHYLPLLVALGAAGDDARATLLETGVQSNVLSLESYAWGVHSAPETFRAC
ncbi:dioxygenase [Leeia sp. TBRC 13508]|uniref:Dioxygenase n=1 Tax=Leeia speluncae TaxID=2884804 RepID=A0ABS8D4Z6_9NEIS|nr:class III extradiol ring-cleavage dioxygenase [Leeia speluncae]MCB6183270.1 dioxygenase [Leeia speluncae]